VVSVSLSAMYLQSLLVAANISCSPTNPSL
jgi:hypothetical protein